METAKIFVERLNELVNEKCASEKLSVNAIAKEVGIKQSTFFRYLKGDREPGISTLAKLSAFFNVSADWLIGLKNYEEE